MTYTVIAHNEQTADVMAVQIEASEPYEAMALASKQSFNRYDGVVVIGAYEGGAEFIPPCEDSGHSACPGDLVELLEDNEYEAAEARATAEYDALVGKDVRVTAISGYRDDDNCHDLTLDPPALVRINQTSDDDIKRWIDEWLDPVYNVTVVEPHPQIAADMRSCWIHGTSYNRKTGKTQPGDIVAEQKDEHGAAIDAALANQTEAQWTPSMQDDDAPQAE